MCLSLSLKLLHGAYETLAKKFNESSFFAADKEARPDVPRSATSIEVDTISNVLSFVLKSLLDDVDVHTAIRNLSNEPIPYFAQITRTEVSSVS